MNKSMWKTTLREIKNSLGRYLAIFAIIGLGVGFFSGLRVTHDAMVEATDGFVKDHAMFDYRLISTLGFTDDDIDELKKTDGIEDAYGAYRADAIVTDNGTEYVASFHSLDDSVNTPSLTYGRMPEKSGEILADGRFYPKDLVGKTITLSDNNTSDTLSCFSRTEFTVVGLAYSPLYLNYERGNSSVGNGTVSYFFLIFPEDFSMPVYTDVYLTVSRKNHIYTDEYNNHIERIQDSLADALSNISDNRYNLYKNLYGMEMPTFSTYILTRNENIGYTCFENDSKIVLGISVVFPVFFFLVAALVCITTMSRMIEEQRTQIGILKALGYGEMTIMAKYMIYSGSAAVLGCVSGFFAGCYAFPTIIWKVYGLMYGFCDIDFVFSTPLFLISLAVALICSVGTTYISCKTDLFNVSAELIRPKAPKNGKRVFIEHITFIWKHLPFLHKVSIRNVFRYKGRFIMMLLGISGCMGLLITGFGIRDSISEACIAPATAWARVQNTETPQLYPVFPWRIYGMGREGLQTARNTYRKDPHAVEMRSTKGWKQDNIWAACLGLTEEAARLNNEKLSDGPYRFPAFWDPGFDWAPDLNRGGAAMVGLQEMLLQETPEGEPILFPAWPKEWNVRFRLHATGGRVIEGEMHDGKVFQH